MDDISHLLKKAVNNLYRIVEEPQFWTTAFSDAFVDWCDAQSLDFPDSVLIRAQLALELANRIGSIHAEAKAHGLMAAAYRRLSVFSQCEAEIQKALQLADSCPCCLAEICRRLGGIRIFQLRLDEAKGFLDEAIAHYQAIDNQDGVGRTLITRGVTLWRLGDTDAALRDEDQALQLLAPETPQFFYTAALTNTAAFLAMGEEHQFVRAEAYLNTLRARLVGVDNVTSIRIFLSWTHGLILARLGERKRALQMLRNARRRLLQNRQDAEVLAITADIGRLYCETARYRNLARLVRDTLGRLGDACGARSHLERILHAAGRELLETRCYLDELRATVAVAVPSLFDAGPPLESIEAP